MTSPHLGHYIMVLLDNSSYPRSLSTCILVHSWSARALFCVSALSSPRPIILSFLARGAVDVGLADIYGRRTQVVPPARFLFKSGTSQDLTGQRFARYGLILPDLNGLIFNGYFGVAKLGSVFEGETNLDLNLEPLETQK